MIEILEPYGYSDVSIITAYLKQTENSQEIVPILVDVMQNRIEELENLRRKQLSIGTMSYGFYYDDYPTDVANRFVSMTLKNIAEVPLSEDNKKWCEEHVPKLKLKNAFYRPLLEELHKNGYYFSNDPEKPEDQK